MKKIVAPATDDPFLSVEQILADLSLSRPSFYKLINDDQFPRPLKIGKLSRWRRSWLERFKASLEPGDIDESDPDFAALQ